MPRTITLNQITKIEGHAQLALRIDKSKITKCELSAMEGSRYFEGIVVGRNYYEAHEMTSRICGICSCAHVIAALSAIENALDITITKQTKLLRELLTLGERIRSHATHLYFLALPDYLGYESALIMAKKHKGKLQHALNLMKVGNGIIKLLGSRDLHPVSATVGGWLKLPKQEEINKIKNDLLLAKEDAKKTCDIFLSLKQTEFFTRGKYFSLVDKKQYAVLDGICRSKDESFEKSQYRNFLKEYCVPYSNACFVTINNSRYMVGALSRINNNYAHLSTDAKKCLKTSKIKLPSHNPFHNNLAQTIELMHCIDHAITICEEIMIKKETPKKPKPKAATGIGSIEVPRGTLWHEYKLNKQGKIVAANIITPTAQNLLNIQEDIRQFVTTILSKKRKEIVLDIEKLIRSYDPCFSCSAHFLEVRWL